MDFPDEPPSVSLREDVYRPLPQTSHLVDWDSVDAERTAGHVLKGLTRGLDENSLSTLEAMFREEGCHWRDTLALTAHLRTFCGKERIASVLADLSRQRGIGGVELASGSAQIVLAHGHTRWVDCFFTFRTKSPKAECKGRLMLVPEQTVEAAKPEWKIWSLSTLLVDFQDHAETQILLRASSKPIDKNCKVVWTEVVIIGGGNAGLAQASRLKAMGIDFIVVEKKACIGDNWGHRYEYLRFHTGKNFSQMPYLPYPDEANHELLRDELREHLRNFARQLDLEPRVLTSTTVAATSWDEARRSWDLLLLTKDQKETTVVRCKAIVIATGTGFHVPNVPQVAGVKSFRGQCMHSDDFRNGKLLAEAGCNSVVVVGSANSAMDVLEDCHDAGLKVTMIQRSPTYVVPKAYYADSRSFGMYDQLPVSLADELMNMDALAVGGQLANKTYASLALAEPSRYEAAKRAGFRLKDSTQEDLVNCLYTRAGGMLTDMEMGGVDLIAAGTVEVRAGSVVALTSEGLKLDDDSQVDADAIVWATGYRHDVRKELSGILGDGAEAIAEKMDATFGSDAEGELRGLFKRLPKVDCLWVLSGGTAQHRWYSRVIALQIKGILEGILPEAYRRSI